MLVVASSWTHQIKLAPLTLGPRLALAPIQAGPLQYQCTLVGVAKMHGQPGLASAPPPRTKLSNQSQAWALSPSEVTAVPMYPGRGRKNAWAGLGPPHTKLSNQPQAWALAQRGHCSTNETW